MTNIFLPLILVAQLFIGSQATVTVGNISDVASLGINVVQMDNLHIYDTQTVIDAQVDKADLIRSNGMIPYAIVYVHRDDDPQDVLDFLSDVVPQIDADIWQVGQEIDLSGGVYGYYGGWGYSYIGDYVDLMEDASAEILANNPDAMIIVGLSANTGYDTWMCQAETLGLSGFISAYGLHLYGIYPTSLYNKTAWQEIITDGMDCVSDPVLVTETGLRYGSGDQEDFEQAQADFIDSMFRDTLDMGVSTVLYYGYNPSWEGVDIKNNTLAKDAMRGVTGDYLNTFARARWQQPR